MLQLLQNVAHRVSRLSYNRHVCSLWSEPFLKRAEHWWTCQNRCYLINASYDVKAVLKYISPFNSPSELQFTGCRHRLMLLLVQRALKNAKWAKNQSESKCSEPSACLSFSPAVYPICRTVDNSGQHYSYIPATKMQQQSGPPYYNSSLGLTQIIQKFQNIIRWHRNQLLGKKLEPHAYLHTPVGTGTLSQVT